MVAKGLPILTAPVLLMTLLVIIHNYGTGTIQTMHFFQCKKSQHILSTKVSKAKLKLSSNLRESSNDPHQTSPTDRNLTPRSFPNHSSGQIKNMLWPSPKKRVWNKQGKDMTSWFRCKYIWGMNLWFPNRIWLKKKKKSHLNNLFSTQSQSEKKHTEFDTWVGVVCFFFFFTDKFVVISS